MKQRAWADAAAMVGVMMAVLMLARGALPFVEPLILRMYGVELWWPGHALLWFRFALPAAIVASGLLGWWLVAAAVAWAAVVVEAMSLNWKLPLSISATVLVITTVLALLLSLPGGFRRGRDTLGRSRLIWLGVAGLLVALAPAARILLRDGGINEGTILYAIDGRVGSAITAAQYAVAAVVPIVLVATQPRAVRLRGFAVLAAVGALVAALVIGGDRPFGFDALYGMSLSLPVSLGLAAVVAAFAVGAVLALERTPSQVPAPGDDAGRAAGAADE